LILPAFWEWLLAKTGLDSVFSIEKVGDELQAGADDLADWATRVAMGSFLLRMRRCCRP